jgi:hypothetical protein
MPPNGRRFSRVAGFIPVSILPVNRKTHFESFFAAPCHVGCKRWLGRFFKLLKSIFISSLATQPITTKIISQITKK